MSLETVYQVRMVLVSLQLLSKRKFSKLIHGHQWFCRSLTQVSVDHRFKSDIRTWKERTNDLTHEQIVTPKANKPCKKQMNIHRIWSDGDLKLRLMIEY